MGKRRLRICSSTHYYGRVPEVRLSGKWFAKQGFNVGDFIDVILEGKQIIIRHTAKEEVRQLLEARSKWRR